MAERESQHRARSAAECGRAELQDDARRSRQGDSSDAQEVLPSLQAAHGAQGDEVSRASDDARANRRLQGCSSVGRAADSKSAGRGFESLRPCRTHVRRRTMTDQERRRRRRRADDEAEAERRGRRSRGRSRARRRRARAKARPRRSGRRADAARRRRATCTPRSSRPASLVAYVSSPGPGGIWNRLADWPTAVRSRAAARAVRRRRARRFAIVVGAAIGVVARRLRLYRKARRPHLGRRGRRRARQGHLADARRRSRTRTHRRHRRQRCSRPSIVALLDRFWGFVTDLVYGA